MSHTIMLRLKNTSTIVRDYTKFPTKENAQNFVNMMNTLFGEDPIVILSVQKY